MDLRLKGKFAIVCASTKGLGFAVAKSLLNEGCEVLICSSKEVNISLASEILLNEGLKNFHSLKVDLSTNEGVVKLFKFAVSKSKRIDILVNNCGGPDQGTFDDVNEEQLINAFNKNLKNIFTLTKLVLPIMKANNWGRIVNITSTSAKQPIDSLILSNIMRSATTSFSKSISNEYARFNIMVNNVLPGRILTDRILQISELKSKESGIDKRDILEALGQDLPIGRIGNPEEFAPIVTFLCSEMSSYITGNSINVDGGLVKSLF
jgi:3-oxoacyl-[acyl-carrier protein] reductase